MDCHRIYEKKIDEDLPKRLENTQQLCDGDINKLCLMLCKVFYPYEYMNECEHHYPQRRNFTATLQWRASQTVNINMPRESGTLWIIKSRPISWPWCIQSNTLLLSDVLESFRNKVLEIYELDPAYFFSVTGLARHTCLKKSVNLELQTDAYMLLTVEKVTRSGIFDTLHRH